MWEITTSRAFPNIFHPRETSVERDSVTYNTAPVSGERYLSRSGMEIKSNHMKKSQIYSTGALLRSGMLKASAVNLGSRHLIPIADPNARENEKQRLSIGFPFLEYSLHSEYAHQESM